MLEHAFSPAERDAVYRAIYERRDMRHFCGGSVSSDLLQRLLQAAHHGPSVGFMQPWRFIRITQAALRQQPRETRVWPPHPAADGSGLHRLCHPEPVAGCPR